MNLGKVGLIGRFKPLHNGGYNLLEAACKNSEFVYIGLGSANDNNEKYNLRNPFTREESKGMVDAVLSTEFSNYKTIYVPDSGHIPKFSDGQKWREFIKDNFGKLDCFISGNPFVRELLKDDFKLLYPTEIIPKEKYVKLKATEVRLAMARYDNWEKFVPKKVADYLNSRGVVDRFRSEFGLQTIALALNDDYLSEDLSAEIANVKLI